MITYGQAVDSGQPICELFDCVLLLHRAVGAAPVQGTIWRYAWTEGADQYLLRMNGTKHVVDYIPLLHVGIEKNGWPLAVFDLFDGTIVGSGTEAELIAALRREIARRGPRGERRGS